MGDIKNLTEREGIEKLKQLAKDAGICLLATELDKKPITARPMSVQEIDDDGNLWFFSRDDSDKNSAIEENSEVQLFFSNKGSSEYLSVYGEATIIKDREKTEELWSPIVKAWFNEGKDDPHISLIKVHTLDAYYWDTKNNKAVQLVKILAGAIAGREMDDGIEGHIR
jgi:general stress protein 26